MNGVLTLLITGSGPHLVAFCPLVRNGKVNGATKIPNGTWCRKRSRRVGVFVHKKDIPGGDLPLYNWGYTCYTSYK